MENKANKFRFMRPAGLALCSCAMLTACATTRYGEDGEILTKEQRESIRIGENTVQTSYDYSRPGSVAPDSKPVWILPVINSGWKPAKIDKETGDWVGGHYSATVVEEGKWATLEEAELSGKPYILPGQTRPVIPTPVKDQSPSSLGELNATTLEQKMARLDRLEKEARFAPSGNNPSKVSLGNQAAIPTLPPSKISQPPAVPSSPEASDKGKPAAPKMKIPGLTADDYPEGEGEKAPSVLLDPPKLPPPPPPIPSTAPSGSSVLERSKSSPAPTTPSSREPVMLTSPTPTPKFDPSTGEIILSYSPPGTSAKVSTPKGEITVSYGPGGQTTISLGKKSKTVTLKNPTEKIKIKIPN